MQWQFRVVSFASDFLPVRQGRATDSLSVCKFACQRVVQVATGTASGSANATGTGSANDTGSHAAGAQAVQVLALPLPVRQPECHGSATGMPA